jgi:hypothetical protein
MRITLTSLAAVSSACVAAVICVASVQADPLSCNLSAYKAAPGLTAAVEGSTLALTWDGDASGEVRMRLAINNGTPTIQDVSVRKKGGAWGTIATNLTPEYRVVSGWRRLDQEAYPALKEVYGQVTQEILDRYKWGAFWDAPLRVPGDEVAHGNSTPPPNGIPGTNQPGLPRKAEEIKRATASYKAQSCEVKTNGGRLEVTFPGVDMGIFAGRLQYTVYKGTNLIRQEVIAKTDEQSVAYKYDAGVKGVAIQPASKLAWRDTANMWQESHLEAAINQNAAIVIAANRVLALEDSGGSLAVFPPPHNFFWTREISVNLGYNWYRKDSDSSFSMGIRQAESEADPAYAGRGPEDRRQNFALYNARPGTWQRMPIYLLVGSGNAQSAVESALAYTRNDHYKPLPGYLVMARHFHTSPVPRLLEIGSLDAVFPDFELARATGVNIYEPVGGGGVVPAGNTPIGPRQNLPAGDAAAARGSGAGGRGGRAGGAGAMNNTAALQRTFDDSRLKGLELYYEMARLQWRKDFMVMPNEELFGIPGVGPENQFPAHNDFLKSHPVYWLPGRTASQPLVEDHATYGKLYHIGSATDMIEMAHRENMVFFMPHPNTKGSAGYPFGFKDKAFFKDEAYRGLGWRWGMDIDRSEERLCEYRCIALWDDVNNWIADLPTPPKFMTAITETYENGPGDDFYANNPVNYIKPDGQPTIDNWAPIVNGIKKGDYFITSGEVLIPSYSVQGTGKQRTISADVEWTFPLEFAEVVWGDGKKTDRQIISVTDLPAFGKHHFQIPFDPTGKKWVRFAVWDSAGNGALVQPIKLEPVSLSSSAR